MGDGGVKVGACDLAPLPYFYFYFYFLILPNGYCPPCLISSKNWKLDIETPLYFWRPPTNPILNALHIEGPKFNIYVHFLLVNKQLTKNSFPKWNQIYGNEKNGMNLEVKNLIKSSLILRLCDLPFARVFCHSRISLYLCAILVWLFYSVLVNTFYFHKYPCIFELIKLR